MTRILCVLTNWKRPDNVAQLVPAWKLQVDRLVVVDNGKADEGMVDDFFCAGAEDVWSWTRNSGPPCRWAPALVDFDFDYVLFADDDFMPKPTAVQVMLNTFSNRDNAVATVGCFGRNLRHGSYRYGLWDYGEVYMTIRCHLVRRDLLHLALQYREQVLRMEPSLCGIHDDFMLCRGINLYTGFPCVAVPGLVQCELDDKQGACHRRPGHLQERQRFVEVDNAIRSSRR